MWLSNGQDTFADSFGKAFNSFCSLLSVSWSWRQSYSVLNSLLKLTAILFCTKFSTKTDGNLYFSKTDSKKMFYSFSLDSRSLLRSLQDPSEMASPSERISKLKLTTGFSHILFMGLKSIGCGCSSFYSVSWSWRQSYSVLNSLLKLTAILLSFFIPVCFSEVCKILQRWFRQANGTEITATNNGFNHDNWWFYWKNHQFNYFGSTPSHFKTQWSE